MGNSPPTTNTTTWRKSLPRAVLNVSIIEQDGAVEPCFRFYCSGPQFPHLMMAYISSADNCWVEEFWQIGTPHHVLMQYIQYALQQQNIPLDKMMQVDYNRGFMFQIVEFVSNTTAHSFEKYSIN